MDNNKTNLWNNGWIQIFISSVLLSLIYYSTLEHLIGYDWARDDYSHGILIPFIVLYLLWEKRPYFVSLPSQPTWLGFLFILPGIALFWMGELAGEYFILYFSLWLLATGLCWSCEGTKRLKAIWFPVFMALTMFPLPNFLNVKLTFQLRLLSSKIGVAMMQLYGMSAYREGNVIDIGFTKLQVVDACSGLRYLFPMLILSILMAYFYNSKPWKKVVLVLSAVPLTIITNSLRIALTGILSERFGSSVVEGFFHDFEGWLIFVITLGVLMGEMWFMNHIFPETITAETDMGDNPNAKTNSVENYNGNRLLQPQFIASIALLSITVLLSQGINFRPEVPLAKPFTDFPTTIGSWKAIPRPMEEKFIEALDLTDYYMADFTNPNGERIDFYVAYYENQQKGESIHSPATCLRGGGWQFKQSGKAFVPLASGQKLSVSRAIIQNGPHRQLSYFWFPMRGRILTNSYQMKWFNFWDALTKQRTDGALVRVIVPIPQNQSPEDTEKTLQAFIKEIAPILSEFLPSA